jgi:hypothetical protein
MLVGAGYRYSIPMWQAAKFSELVFDFEVGLSPLSAHAQALARAAGVQCSQNPDQVGCLLNGARRAVFRQLQNLQANRSEHVE